MSYQIDGAILKVQGVKVAIVLVKRHIIENRDKAQEARNAYSYVFPGMPIVLVGQDLAEPPTYYGKKDILNVLAKVDYRKIPWKHYTIESN